MPDLSDQPLMQRVLVLESQLSKVMTELQDTQARLIRLESQTRPFELIREFAGKAHVGVPEGVRRPLD